MDMMKRLAVAAAMVCSVFTAHAQNTYPSRPIEMVVAYAPGGGTDIIGRYLADQMSRKLGQSVVVSNLPGATGQVGSLRVARSKPDGHTLQIAVQTTHAVAPTLYGKIPYDPVKDFTPIIRVVGTPLALVTTPQTGVKTMKEMVDLIRAKPDKVNQATGGIGDGGHLASMIFNNMLKINPVFIPHQGEGPAMTSMLGGQTTYMFALVPTAAPFIRSGKIVPLAVTGATRAESLPNVPTLDESGLKGYQMETWWGIFGPANMPREVVDKLNTVINDILKEPEVVTKLKSLGYEIRGGTPEAFGQFVKDENVRWKDIITSQGLAGTAGK